MTRTPIVPNQDTTLEQTNSLPRMQLQPPKMFSMANGKQETCLSEFYVIVVEVVVEVVAVALKSQHVQGYLYPRKSQFHEYGDSRARPYLVKGGWFIVDNMWDSSPQEQKTFPLLHDHLLQVTDKLNDLPRITFKLLALQANGLGWMRLPLQKCKCIR